MKKGIIFTKDKTEIDVFFLKAHVPPEIGWQLGHQIGDGTMENPFLVDDETGEALMEDDKDCCGELDVNENSAGEGSHKGWVTGNIFEASALENIVEKLEDIGGDWPHALTPQGVSLPIHPDDLDKVSSCCPVGHKGHQGSIGVAEDEVDMFEAICECLEKFSLTDLSIDNSDSRDILSITITRKIKDL